MNATNKFLVLLCCAYSIIFFALSVVLFYFEMIHYIVEIRNNFDAEVFRDELIQPSLAFNPATYREINRPFNKYRFRGCKLTLTFEPVSYQADLFKEDDLPF